MKYLCAWCDAMLRESTPEQGQTVSHGICATCLARVLSDLRAASPTLEAGRHPYQPHRHETDRRREQS